MTALSITSSSFTKSPISASEFANYLSSSSDVITLTDSTNLSVQTSTQTHTAINANYSIIYKSDLSAGYDGTNRLNGVLVQDTAGTSSKNVYWADNTAIDVNVSEALMIPTMGSAPHVGHGQITLEDTAEKLSAGLKAFTDGQISSFNVVEISDNNILVLDPDTFKRLDTADQSASWSSHNGTSLINTNGTTPKIKVAGSIAEFTAAGLWDGTNLTTSLKSDAYNLAAFINEISLDGTISSTSELSSYLNVITASSTAGITLTTNLKFTSSFASSGLTAAEFISLAEFDTLATAQDIIADNFTAGITIADTTDNIKSLITNTSSSVIPFKTYINSITSTSDSGDKIQLTWEEYMGALSGTSFDSTDTTTWSTSSVAFQNLGNIELIVAMFPDTNPFIS